MAAQSPSNSRVSASIIVVARTAAFFIFAMSGCSGDDDGPVESLASMFQAPTAEAAATPTSRPQTPVAAPSPTPVFTGPTVTIGAGTFGAEVAHTPADRVRGLSDRDELAPGTGMLFVFESGVVSSFWMNGMRFALDFVWIGADCTVAGTTVNVPPPASDSDTSPPIFNSPAPAAYTFEINEKEVNEYGIEVGDPVSFSGFSVVGAEC